ncbi:MAG: hypothetical protein IPM29_02835 [Planctomycetes bacterium]|nr:hypothetical protein [Planctomycetota bacterium]
MHALLPVRRPAPALGRAVATLLVAAIAGAGPLAPRAAAQRLADVFGPGDAPWEALGLHRSLDWVLDPERFVDSRAAKRAIRGAFDRVAALDAAIERAGNYRLVLWYVPRVVEDENRGRQMYRAPVLDLYAWQCLFNDPDVVDLIASRFVPVRLHCDEPLSARFGLRPLDFVEPAVVVIDGTGAVVHVCERMRTFDPLWFVTQLRLALLKAGDPGEPPADVEGLLAQGRWDRAARAIAALPEDGHKAYLLSRLHRLERRPDEALRTLALAAERGGVDPGDLAAERIRVLMLAGRDAELPDTAPESGARAAEAHYLLALAALRAGHEDAAHERFEHVAATWPDTLFGRRARANVTLGNDSRPLGAAFTAFESLRYLDDAAYRELAPDTEWHGPALSSRELARRGLEHLLENQRDDGGFKDCRYAYWPSPSITPNAWIAITALAATAMLELRDVAPDSIPPERVDAAIARAEQYLFAPEHVARGQNEDVYADAYRLLFLSRRAGRSDGDERARLVARMNEVVREATQRQKTSGFWAHEYENAFCTAAMLRGLRLAELAGAEIPPESLSNGVSALLAARFETGTFVYGGAAGRRGRPTSEKDSATRMPLCEGVLLDLGQSDPARLRRAVEIYWEYMDRIERVRRNDFHSDGEIGGFFFFHSLFHAAELTPMLPEDLREMQRERTIALLQRIPELDASYLDSHEIGRTYGTAMAMLALCDVGALRDE